jgi:hypothetical protein
MLRIANIQTLRTMNFIFGMALLMMISPQHGHLPEKPAGVRSAVELVGKRTALRTVALGAAFAWNLRLQCKDQARRGRLREQFALRIGQAPFGLRRLPAAAGRKALGVYRRRGFQILHR